MHRRNITRGFTLIEIMTAVSIFAVVTTISMGSILAIFDVNRKSESIKAVMDNLNLSLETMAREMRFGYRYSCEPSLPADLNPGSGATLQTCTAGGHWVAFYVPPTPSNLPPPAPPPNPLGNRTIVYRQNGSRLEKSTLGGASGTFVPVTAPEINIQDVSFYVIGSLSGDPLQPKVLIKIRGQAGVKEGTITDFTIQTLVSQRRLDT